MKIAEVSEKYGIPQETLRYYERVGILPEIKRKCGIRDYSEDDCNCVEMARCLRSAGLTVEAIAEYRRLMIIGDETFQERLDLLKNERNKLDNQKKAIEEAINLLDYKIERYDIAVKTGKLSWDD